MAGGGRYARWIVCYAPGNRLALISRAQFIAGGRAYQFISAHRYRDTAQAMIERIRQQEERAL